MAELQPPADDRQPPRGDLDAPNDPLAALRADLDDLEDVAVEDRVALFERVNDALANELAALDEV